MMIDELLQDPGFRAVVSRFVGELPKRIEAIEEAAQSGDLDAVERAAHQLAGAGGGFGFGLISRDALELERCVRSPSSAESIPAAIASLRAEAQTAVAGWDDEPTVAAS